MQRGHLREVLAELVEEHRLVGVALGLTHVVAVVRPRHAAAGAIGVEDRRYLVATRDEQAHERREVVEAVVVGEHLGVRGRQLETPRCRIRGVGGEREDAVGGLLFEPLAGVALGDAGAGSQLGRGRGAARGERAVEAEPVADVDAVGRHRAEQVAKESLNEGLGLLALDGWSRCLGHEFSLLVSPISWSWQPDRYDNASDESGAADGGALSRWAPRAAGPLRHAAAGGPPRGADRAPDVQRRRARVHRAAVDVLPRDGGRRWAPELLVQGRNARVRARGRARHARLSEL